MTRFQAIGLLLFSGAIASAQVPTLPPIRELLFPPQVKQYIGLTDEQVGRVLALNAGLAQFQAAKSARQIQVQIEIVQETQRENLDPMALGLRYLELEGIRRELDRERAKVIAAVQALLTEPQKLKVAALRQVMVDYPTACAGAAVNVVPVPQVLPANRVVVSPEPFTSVVGAILAVPPATCVGAVPTAAVRIGEFTAQQP
ncbi:MAG: hypothetical protein ABI972_17810 [Acidobacteriota bacterium]